MKRCGGTLKVKRATIKGYILSKSNNMIFWKSKNYGDSKNIRDLVGGRDE